MPQLQMQTSTSDAPAGILVVEDETLVAFYLQDALEAIGYECCAIADSAEEALRAAEELRPALALVDIGLRGSVDGITLARKLRKRFGIPVIFLTGASDADTVRRAKAAHPAGFLSKPCLEDDLARALGGALGSMGRKA